MAPRKEAEALCQEDVTSCKEVEALCQEDMGPRKEAEALCQEVGHHDLSQERMVRTLRCPISCIFFFPTTLSYLPGIFPWGSFLGTLSLGLFPRDSFSGTLLLGLFLRHTLLGTLPPALYSWVASSGNFVKPVHFV